MTVLFTAIMIFRGRSVNETVRSRVFQISFFTNDIMIIGGREMSASKITSDVNTHPVTFFQLVTIQMSISLTHHRKTVVSIITMESFHNTSATSMKVDRTHIKTSHSLKTI